MLKNMWSLFLKPACRQTSLPKNARKVSLSAISRCSNDVVCVDHFFIDGIILFHLMDSAT